MFRSRLECNDEMKCVQKLARKYREKENKQNANQGIFQSLNRMSSVLLMVRNFCALEIDDRINRFIRL